MQTAIQPLVWDASSIENLPDEHFVHTESEPGVRWKTLLCSSQTPSDTFTCGVAVCAPKTGKLQLHRHKSAELYHFIQGTGVVEIDGVAHPARPGSVMFIPGNAEHRVKNVSETEDLKWLYVFAVDSFGEIVYEWQEDNAELDSGTVDEVDRMKAANVSRGPGR
ncbi:hypothetical protein CKM354_000219500 [Cercospora kikuchii]|uniref:Cupin type-2 domain-containing protein n=1 Tax=Cercospora kikuchii TaxID=84275 RepID=A0A9P3C9D9_9PEZI|nr:uncharacterized protein CKM354_000219500 [Cercospora kikuchii]GIZ38794.1 hypothetical protein CKM354_000219500 [Cercospora kikuchii]